MRTTFFIVAYDTIYIVLHVPVLNSCSLSMIAPLKAILIAQTPLRLTHSFGFARLWTALAISSPEL